MRRKPEKIPNYEINVILHSINLCIINRKLHFFRINLNRNDMAFTITNISQLKDHQFPVNFEF